MKRKVSGGAVTLDGITLPILGGKTHSSFEEILRRMKEQLDAMLSHHCKILVIRFDLRLPFMEYTPDNKIMSQLMRKIRKKLKARYEFKRIGYVWARELDRAKHQHYHCVLIIDGNKVRAPLNLQRICDDVAVAWELSIFWCRQGSYLIKRNDQKAYSACYKRLSYLAKTRCKGYKADSANDYSTSRIKAKVE